MTYEGLSWIVMLVVFACIILTNHLPNHVKVVDSLNSEHSDSDCV